MIDSVFINAYWMLQSVCLLESVAKNNIYWRGKGEGANNEAAVGSQTSSKEGLQTSTSQHVKKRDWTKRMTLV